MKEALAFVDKLSEQKLVLDHCGKPDIKNKQIKGWAQLIKELSQYKHVYCKLSGLLTEADWHDWKEEDFYPYLDIIFSFFGAERVMFGGDWPVMLLGGRYAQWIDVINNYVQQFSIEHRNAVFGENAVKFYNIKTD